MKASLALRMGQSLTMTPALQQAIRMLQLSSMDLQQEISQVLESNLMIEQIEDPPADNLDAEADPDSNDSAEDTIPDELPVDAEWDDVYDGATHTKSGVSDELYEFQQANLHTAPTLIEHLSWQAGLQGYTPAQGEIAAHLIDSVDERGYIDDWPSVAARLKELGHKPDAVETVLATVQQFDPTGVAARDLSECLRLQLDSLGLEAPQHQLAAQICERHLENLGRNDLRTIARALRAQLDDVQAAADIIRHLQPSPGTPFVNVDRDYITPEVFVSKRNGRWTVALNPDIAPRLRINSTYTKLIKRADNSPDQRQMKEHLQEARYFLNSLKSRNDTLLRVAQCIIEQQRAFMDYGEEAMKPLVLRDIADRLNVHESTVSRATSAKYMHTPRGVFELKYFFSSHVGTAQGGQCSATAIQAMIKRLVTAEPANKPLSDSKLAKLLNEDGIHVARRTVAKYREALDIPPSHERKKMA
ncbi:RNA polymerase factor sigma-54 [bacterium]|nr:RNA polymerase factor sigma-54 [bacterium]